MADFSSLGATPAAFKLPGTPASGAPVATAASPPTTPAASPYASLGATPASFQAPAAAPAAPKAPFNYDESIINTLRGIVAPVVREGADIYRGIQGTADLGAAGIAAGVQAVTGGKGPSPSSFIQAGNQAMTTPTNVPGFGPQQPFANAEDRAGNALQVGSMLAVPEGSEATTAAEGETPVVYKSFGDLAKTALKRGGTLGGTFGLGTGLQQSGQGGFSPGRTAATVALNTLGGVALGTVADMAGQVFTRPEAVTKIVDAAKAGDPSAIAARDALVKHEVSPLANLGLNVTAKAKGDFQDIHGQTLPDFVATERLPIGKVAGENKPYLDTKVTTDAIDNRVAQMNTQAQSFLASKTDTFDLEEQRAAAKAVAAKFEKNATVLKATQAKIDTYFDDEIAANGGSPTVSAAQMNNIKGGMGRIGFTPSDPYAQPAAKAGATALRATLRSKYGEDSAYSALSDLESKYLDAKSSLEGMHKGAILETPKIKQIKSLSRNLGGAGGAAIGAGIGQHFGSVEAGGGLGMMAGGGVGEMAGNAITSRMMNDPASLMNQASARLEKLGIPSEFTSLLTGLTKQP